MMFDDEYSNPGFMNTIINPEGKFRHDTAPNFAIDDGISLRCGRDLRDRTFKFIEKSFPQPGNFAIVVRGGFD